MMKKMIVLVVLASVGCASGFDRGKIRQDMYTGKLQVTDQRIYDVKKLKSQIQFPMKIAVALYTGYRYRTRWTDEDKQVIIQAMKPLQRAGIVDKIFYLPSMLLSRRSTIRDVRVAAARMGANVLLVMSAANNIDSYSNPSSVLYLTIVGMFVVPGSHRDALCMMEGILFDVNNEYIYASVEADGKGSTWGPLVMVDWKDAAKVARKKALKGFAGELQKRLANLKGAKIVKQKAKSK